MPILAMDTSSNLLSVVLFEGEKVIAKENSLTKMQHGVLLIPKIQELLDSVQLEPSDIEGIIIGVGPGSYTGLRIGMTAAKMWGISQQIPVYPVSSLAVMARGVEPTANLKVIIPIINARRLSAYVGVYIYQEQSKLTALCPDQHVELGEWLEKMTEEFAKFDEIIFVGHEIEELLPVIQAYSAKQKITIIDQETALPNMERSYDLITEPVADIHLLAPNYTQITLAEREWFEKEQKETIDEALVDTTIN